MSSPTRRSNALDLMEPGDKLELCFCPDGIEGLRFLVQIHHQGQVELKSDDHNQAEQIIRSGSWGSDSNRIFTILVTNTFDLKAFETNLGSALKFVWLQPHRPFVDRNALMAVQSGQRLRLHFEPDGFPGLGEVIELIEAGFVDCHSPTREVLECSYIEGEWWHNPDRREVVVVINPSFVRERELMVSFFGTMLTHLEFLRIQRIASPRIHVTSSI
jgi:hypothetical protein